MAGLAVVSTAGLVVAVGTTPAAARAARHVPPAATAFSHPVPSASVHSPCQPTPKRPCPHTNPVWSGYVLTPVPGHPFTNVSASWIQKSARCPESNAWALFWVGIDGLSSSDGSQTVEQGGTSAQCVNGIPQYSAWWEMYPTNDVQTTFPIDVGDHVSASVVYSATDATYTITVDDVTTGDSLVAVSTLATASGDLYPPNTYTVTVTENGVATVTGPTPYAGNVCNVGMPCENASAEWVVEAPGGNGSPGVAVPSGPLPSCHLHVGHRR